MFYRILVSALCLTGALTLPAIAASSIQGEVRGTDGRPVTGAEVRFDRRDKSTAAFITTTDASGRYQANGLPVAMYRVSVVINGATKSSVDMRTAQHNARLDFDLKGVAGKKVKHYVLMGADTGSHLGGRWVEVDDAASTAGTLNIDRMSAEFAREMTRHQSNPRQ